MTEMRMLSVDEALDYLLGQAAPVSGRDVVMLDQALGRVLADSQVSAIAVPGSDNSAMDGYAVRAADLASQTATRLPVSQRIAAGAVGRELAPGSAARIFTGAPIPAGADAVVMQEDTEADGDAVLIKRSVEVGQNVRRAGEDIRPGATILSAGTAIGPQHIGLAASVGIARLPVYRRLRVATFFTGDELVMPGTPLGPGQIYNSNRFTLNGLLRALGFEPLDLGIVPDSLEATVNTLAHAARHADVVLTSGGMSVGEEDYVRPALERLGQVEMWRVAMKPGKPLAFGRIDQTAVIGLPGNPVSVFVTFCLFARPFLLRSQGAMTVAPSGYPVEADFDWLKPDRRREFLRARLSTVAGRTLAQRYPNQGSGVLTSTVWADGLIDVAPNSTIRRGDMVRYLPLSALLSWH